MEAGCFAGTVTLGDTLVDRVLTVDTAHTPTAPAAAPTFVVYGPSGVVTSGTTSQTGAVTGLYQASIVMSAGNGFAAGTPYQIVYSYSVGGTARGQVHHVQVS